VRYFIPIIGVFVIGLGIIYYKLYYRLEINEVEVSIHEAPLVAELSFAVKHPIKVKIKYWLKDNDKVIGNTLNGIRATNHAIKLVGLKGSRNYEYQIVSEDGRVSKVFEFITPKVVMPPMLKVLWTEKNKVFFSGFILSQRTINLRGGQTSNGFVYLTDSVGEVVWYQSVEGLPKVSLVTPQKTFLIVSGSPQQERSAGDHLYEFDIYGNQLLGLDLSTLSQPFEIHHDVGYLPNGNLIALIYDKRNFGGLSPANGANGKREVKGDAIVQIDKQGNILWKWSVFDVVSPESSPFPVDSLGEWGHANTLSIDTDGHYLISFRDWNQVWKIDSSSGAVIWRLGEDGDFVLPEEFFFSGQHAIHVNYKNEYMMYDNGVKKGKSRVLCFTIDESFKKVAVKRIIPLPEILSSPKRGSAYYIDDRRILVCSPETSSLAIVDEDGSILARAHTGLPDFYRAVFISGLY
jgi:arylsulfate sulfotransferase